MPSHEMKDSSERWLPVAGFGQTYEVSDLGRFRYAVNRFGLRCDIIRNPVKNSNGYMLVQLGKTRRYLHRLVLETFKPRVGMDALQSNHRNGVKADNRLANLEWVTPKANIAHAYATGLRRGRKLTRREIVGIRAAKGSRRVVADKFQVCRAMVSRIKNGKCHSEVV